MEKPIHVIHGVEEVIGGLDREERPISGDSMCAICWPSYPFMAFSRSRSRDGCFLLQLLSWSLWRSDCLSGISFFLQTSLCLNLKQKMNK